jgi:hypothetical protein
LAEARHVSTQAFYARIKYKGKTIRASLHAKVITVALEKLPDKIKQLNRSKAITGTFGQYRQKSFSREQRLLRGSALPLFRVKITQAQVVNADSLNFERLPNQLAAHANSRIIP